MKFAVVDLETTGLKASRHRITEIAIILHDGEKEISRWHTLINPEVVINTAITELTGITNDLVNTAPKFYEVAKQIVELTEDYVFVGHNVRFDYTFLREEFSRLGFTYTRKQLCTLQLARRVFPGGKSYALGKLCKKLNIHHQDAHRAVADAQATADLMKLCLARDQQEVTEGDTLKSTMRESLLPGGMSMKQILNLPDKCGVYYFLNKRKEVVYVGKSQNIRRRVLEHFGQKDDKGNRLHNQVRSIKFELTGSELVALLFESHEIKRLLPPINRAQRRRYFPYVLHRVIDDKGIVQLDVCRIKAGENLSLDVIAEYSSSGKAKGALQFIQQEYDLCGRFVNLEKGKDGTPCFHYHLKSCQGICAGLEDVEDYNARVEEAIEHIKTVFGKDFFVIDEGRTSEEEAVILVEKGRYQGYGYRLKPKRRVKNPDQKKLRAVIEPFRGNPETARIIKRFVREGDVQVVPI
ncbi:MAG: exonuclease domain-containing protein [Saprospiraceae bacterium]